MHSISSVLLALWFVVASGAPAQAGDGPPIAQRAKPGTVQAPAVIDVNRPRTPFDCDLPIGVEWYGSRERCLAELCAGQNVYNEYLFDGSERRRKNPCYGQSATEFPDK